MVEWKVGKRVYFEVALKVFEKAEKLVEYLVEQLAASWDAQLVWKMVVVLVDSKTVSLV